MIDKAQSKPQMASFIQLTKEAKNALIHVLDISRKYGSRQEASLALNFITIIEENAANITKQFAVVKKVEKSSKVEKIK